MRFFFDERNDFNLNFKFRNCVNEYNSKNAEDQTSERCVREKRNFSEKKETLQIGSCRHDINSEKKKKIQLHEKNNSNFISSQGTSFMFTNGEK